MSAKPDMLEKAWQEQVRRVARDYGWTRAGSGRGAPPGLGFFFHVFDSRNSPAGWPDIFMVRPSGDESKFPYRMVIAELKRDGTYPSREQAYVLDLFMAQFPEPMTQDDTPAVEIYLWRPRDRSDVNALLRGEPPRNPKGWRQAWQICRDAEMATVGK